MEHATLFTLGFERSRWLAARIATSAGNVANADTPGYRTREVASFEAAMNGIRVEIGRTHRSHIAPEHAPSHRYGSLPRAGTEKHSGNNVSLEAEMASLGEARSQQSALTGVLGAFHRMLLAGSRG
jgi:flagellar basal-body rod protein FlgB